MTPLIINTAFTGAVSDKARNPNVPYSAEEVRSDAVACAASGTAMGHFHVRTEAGAATNDPELYARLFAALGGEPALTDLVMVASTSGRHGQTIDERTAVLKLPADLRPDMASLTLSSLNFATGPSITSPDDIRRLAEAMQTNGVKPELEVFDLGMAAFARTLAKEGLIKPPFYVNIILGNVAGAQADAMSVAALLHALPSPTVVSIGGIGRAQMPAHLLALAEAEGVRTGLEDNLRNPDGSLTSNPELVARIAAIAKLAGREIETAAGLRTRLELPSR